MPEQDIPTGVIDQNTPDVTVILMMDGEIVNGTEGVLEGLNGTLGKGVLGYMTLGD